MPDSDPSAFLLYGVCAAEGPKDLVPFLQRQAGVQEAPLLLVEGDALSVVVSPVSPPSLQPPDPAAALTYRSVVDAVHAHRAIVPLRFGTTVPTKEKARGLLARHRDAVGVHLERFEGRVEVGVRLEVDPSFGASEEPPVQEGDSGRAYLEARRDERRRTADRIDTLFTAYRTAVGTACVDATAEWTDESDPPVVSLAFLVPRSQEEPIRDRLSTVSPAEVDEAYVVGPWAPYSFAEL